jgi:NTP pyrophosphatase (non-canonical NTP hydrolase)
MTLVKHHRRLHVNSDNNFIYPRTILFFMTLKSIQDDVDKFVGQFEVTYWEPLEIMAHITEETGELARELNHRFGPKQKKSTEDVKEVGEEISDMFFSLCCLANSLNIDLDAEWKKTMDKCYTRDKNRFKKSQKTQ